MNRISYLDGHPSPYDVDMTTGRNTEIIFLSSINIEQGFKQLRTANTVEKRRNATWTGDGRRLWMLMFIVYSRFDDFWVSPQVMKLGGVQCQENEPGK